MRTPDLLIKRTVAGVAVLLGGAALALNTQAQPAFGDWSPNVPVPGVAGGCPIESRNGLRLYVARFGETGTRNIYSYSRKGRSRDFSDSSLVADPVSLADANDFCPTPLQGKWLMFVSDRAIEGVSCGGTDIYMARFNPAKGWSEPMHLGCAPDGPNTDEDELSPSLVTTSAGTQLYFSTGPLAGPQDLYVSDMAPDGSFGEGEAIEELNTDGDDRQPNVRRDGLEMVFARGGDIWSASRESVEDAWQEDSNLSDGFDTQDAGESRPSLSWDGTRLYYGSGGTIYRSERKPGR